MILMPALGLSLPLFGSLLASPAAPGGVHTPVLNTSMFCRVVWATSVLLPSVWLPVGAPASRRAVPLMGMLSRISTWSPGCTVPVVLSMSVDGKAISTLPLGTLTDAPVCPLPAVNWRLRSGWPPKTLVLAVMPNTSTVLVYVSGGTNSAG